jgi:hypothetical protein
VVNARATLVFGAVVVLLLAMSEPASADPTCPALALNGSSGYATASSTVFPNSTALSTFTAEAWIRPGFIPSDHNSQVIISDDAYDLWLEYVPGVIVRLVVRFWGQNGTQLTFFDNRFVNINTWHHVAVVFDGNTKQLRFVLDGAVGAAVPVNLTGFSTFSSNLIVGAFPTSAHFNGNIDEVRISDVARYTSGFTPPNTLTLDANTRALYRFNEAAGATTFADSSGNGFTLTGAGGAQTSNANCVVPPVPTVTAIDPNTGSTFGGTPVTISGTNFVAGSTVAIGGTAATNVNVTSATTITAVTPAHAAGVVSVVVTTPDSLAGTLTNGFTYAVVPAPTVSSVAPPSGTTAGGTAITVTGAHFANGATVTIGGVAATSVVVGNATTITAVTGARATGRVSVVVANQDAQAGTLMNGFHYVTPFTDATLSATSSGIRAVHVVELRARINAVRQANGLAAVAWTDATLDGVVVKLVHLTELRAALVGAYQAAQRVPPSFTDPTPSTSTSIKAIHIAELRIAVVALE